MLDNADRTFTALSRLLRDEDGQTLGEYAVLVGFIAVVAVVAATLVGGAILGLFNQATGVF